MTKKAYLPAILAIFMVLNPIIVPVTAIAEDLPASYPVQNQEDETPVVLETPVLTEEIEQTSEDIVEEIITKTELPSQTSVWDYSDATKTAITTENIVSNVKYIFPGNEKVTITFTKLPAETAKLSIKEVLLSESEKFELGANVDKAYEITSEMQNGTFEYTLTLPSVGQNSQVKYATDLNSEYQDIESQNVNDTVTINSNHFTLFVVIPTADAPTCAGMGVTIGTDCFATIQEAVNAATNGDTINIEPGIYNEYVLITKSLTLVGSGKGTNPAVDTIIEPVGSSGQAGIEISNTSNVSISNLRVQNTPNGAKSNLGSGIIVRTGIDMSNLYFNNIALVGNTGNGLSFIGAGNVNVNNISITNSIISNNVGRGLKFNIPITSFNNILIDNNSIVNNGYPGIFMNKNIINATVTNNVISGNYSCGVMLLKDLSNLINQFEFHFNKVYSNGSTPGCGFYSSNELPRVNAQNNYWGSDQGPRDEMNDLSLPILNDSENGESVFGAIDYSNILETLEAHSTLVVRKLLWTSDLIETNSADLFTANVLNSDSQVIRSGSISDNGNFMYHYNNPGNLSISQTFYVDPGTYTVTEDEKEGFINTSCISFTNEGYVTEFTLESNQTLEVVCFNVIDSLPSVTIDATPSDYVLEPETIVLTANVTGGNPSFTYDWTCDTLETSNTQTLELTEVGTHYCELTVTDFDGDTDSTGGTYTIEPTTGTIIVRKLLWDQNITEIDSEDLFTVNVQQQLIDEESEVTLFRGESIVNSDTISDNGNLMHYYSAPGNLSKNAVFKLNSGTYTVTEEDSEGYINVGCVSFKSLSETVSTFDLEAGQTIEVICFNVVDSLPSVSINANPAITVTTPQTILLTANVVGGNSPISYDWTCNTGETGTSQTLNLTTVGVHNCTVTVTDLDGDTDSASGTFTINEQAIQPTNLIPSVVLFGNSPAVNSLGTVEVAANTNFNVRANLTSLGNPNYNYSFGGICAGTINNTVASFVDSNTLNLSAGNYICSVNVTDSNGDIANASVTINVVNGIGGAGQVQGTETTNNNSSNSNGGQGEVKGIEDQVCTTKSTVSGFVFQDLNGNNKMDNSETGLENINLKIFVLDENNSELEIVLVKTNRIGYWETELCPGQYSIRIDTTDLPEGTFLGGTDTFSFNVNSEETENVNFAVYSNTNNGFNWWIFIIIILLVLLVAGGYAAYNTTRRNS